MPSKVSKFDGDQKVVALLLTEMLKVECKDVRASTDEKIGLSSTIYYQQLKCHPITKKKVEKHRL